MKKTREITEDEKKVFAIGQVKIIKTKANSDVILEERAFEKNRIMLGTNTGKSLILNRLNSDNTYTLNITHADIGTSSTAAADSDTQLGAAVARQAKVTGTISSNVLTLKFFFNDANLANGTYNEFGSFVDGSASVNTGKIFNRIIFGTPYVKATGEDTTVILTITLV